MQFLSPRSCNFKIARVNHSAISARFSAISRRFLTKLSHKDPSGVFFTQDFSSFCMVMANTDKKNLRSPMSSSSPSTGNSISDTQTGSSNSKVFLNIHACLPVHFPSC